MYIVFFSKTLEQMCAFQLKLSISEVLLYKYFKFGTIAA